VPPQPQIVYSSPSLTISTVISWITELRIWNGQRIQKIPFTPLKQGFTNPMKEKDGLLLTPVPGKNTPPSKKQLFT
jgi:hypothetical protein